MTKLEILKIGYELMDIITNYDYSDCINVNDTITEIFHNIMVELDREEAEIYKRKY